MKCVEFKHILGDYLNKLIRAVILKLHMVWDYGGIVYATGDTQVIHSLYFNDIPISGGSARTSRDLNHVWASRMHPS